MSRNYDARKSKSRRTSIAELVTDAFCSTRILIKVKKDIATTPSESDVIAHLSIQTCTQ